MKTKHTPGPWRVSLKNAATGTYTANTDSGRYVAIICDHPKRELSEEMLPNAKLIAASPDLLQSLQEYVDYFKEWEYVLNDEMRAMLNKAEEAIKKAV